MAARRPRRLVIWRRPPRTYPRDLAPSGSVIRRRLVFTTLVERPSLLSSSFYSHARDRRSRHSRMPRKKKGKRAIGDLIRGAREDKPRKVPAKDGNGMPSPSVGAATGEAGAARDPEPAPASCVVDVDPARRLLFGWSLRRFLDARPPSTVVQLSRDDTVGGAMAKLARHGILSAPVVDERNLVFHGYARAREPRRNRAPGASTRPRREIGRVFFFSSRGFFPAPLALAPRASRLARRSSRVPFRVADFFLAWTFCTPSWTASTRASRVRRTPRGCPASRAWRSSTPSPRNSSPRR